MSKSTKSDDNIWPVVQIVLTELPNVGQIAQSQHFEPWEAELLGVEVDHSYHGSEVQINQVTSIPTLLKFVQKYAAHMRKQADAADRRVQDVRDDLGQEINYWRERHNESYSELERYREAERAAEMAKRNERLRADLADRRVEYLTWMTQRDSPQYNAIAAEQKITLIKHMRTHYDYGLRECKDRVDAFWDEARRHVESMQADPNYIPQF